MFHLHRRAGTVLAAAAIAAGALLAGASVLGQPAQADGAAAEAILAELAKLSKPQADLVKAPAAQARQALDRARSAKSSGDIAHAAELEGLAREWAETARDLLRAAAIEADAGAAQVALRTTTTQAERNRALVEEAVARKMRAAAELEKLESSASEAASAAPHGEGAGSDGGGAPRAAAAPSRGAGREGSASTPARRAPHKPAADGGNE